MFMVAGVRRTLLALPYQYTCFPCDVDVQDIFGFMGNLKRKTFACNAVPRRPKFLVHAILNKLFAFPFVRSFHPKQATAGQVTTVSEYKEGWETDDTTTRVS